MKFVFGFLAGICAGVYAQKHHADEVAQTRVTIKQYATKIWEEIDRRTRKN